MRAAVIVLLLVSASSPALANSPALPPMPHATIEFMGDPIVGRAFEIAFDMTDPDGPRDWALHLRVPPSVEIHDGSGRNVTLSKDHSRISFNLTSTTAGLWSLEIEGAVAFVLSGPESGSWSTQLRDLVDPEAVTMETMAFVTSGDRVTIRYWVNGSAIWLPRARAASSLAVAWPLLSPRNNSDLGPPASGEGAPLVLETTAVVPEGSDIIVLTSTDLGVDAPGPQSYYVSVGGENYARTFHRDVGNPVLVETGRQSNVIEGIPVGGPKKIESVGSALAALLMAACAGLTAARTRRD